MAVKSEVPALNMRGVELIFFFDSEHENVQQRKNQRKMSIEDVGSLLPALFTGLPLQAISTWFPPPMLRHNLGDQQWKKIGR